MVFVLPALSTLCMVKFGMGALSKDLWLARASGITITIGSVMVAFAFSPWLLSVGSYSSAEHPTELLELTEISSHRLLIRQWVHSSSA